MDHTTQGAVRVHITRPRLSVLRIRWSVQGRVLGEKRCYDDVAVLRAPAGLVLIEVFDERAVHDPQRLAPARVVVGLRAGWTTDVDVAMSPGACVNGRVFADDSPSRFAHVVAHLADGSKVGTRCDGTGEFTLAGLPAGMVRVGAWSGSRASLHRCITTFSGRPSWTTFALELPHLDTPILMPGRVGGAFAGQVVDRAGVPAARAIVTVRDARGVQLARGRTDRTGEFIVGGNLHAGAGLTVEAMSGPEHITVIRAVRRGLGVRPGQVVDLGTIELATPVTELSSSACPDRSRTRASR